MQERIGLFLGAGASYELGMPLAWHLTGEFKGFYTPEHFRRICAEAETHDVRISARVQEETVRLLGRPDLHYENILGYLQTSHRRLDQSQDVGRQYHRLYGSMLEIVYALLYHRQVRNHGYILRGMPAFEGLRELAEKTKPLWIFSLNHDVMIEMLACRLELPLKDGFWSDKRLTIPNPDSNGEQRAPLAADVLTQDDLDSGNLDFFSNGPGINLLKVHGALNMFACREGKDLCRLVPTGDDEQGFLDALVVANEQLGHWINGHKVGITGEIVFTDENGIMQFLRRTLLAGAQKFNARYDQTLPHKMLSYFSSYVNHVKHLYVVGYSFGDPHVDAILREWLESFSARSMTIVDPHRKDVPVHLRHVAPQVRLSAMTASDFFASHRKEPLTRSQNLERRLRAAIRPWMERRAAIKWPTQQKRRA